MGKYMKKSTTKSVPASTEIPISSTGVRTRAKTLALQKLQNHKKPSTADPVTDESSYLQLRSRRLLKLKPLQQDHNTIDESGSCPNFSSIGCLKSKLGFENVKIECNGVDDGVEIMDFEVSFAENNFDFESGQIRNSRETTPCNSARGSDCFGTPDSTTRSPLHTSLPRHTIQNAVQQIMPSASELEEFFASAEQQQRRLFIDKYNFDVASERPMRGRYEWVQVKP